MRQLKHACTTPHFVLRLNQFTMSKSTSGCFIMCNVMLHWEGSLLSSPMRNCGRTLEHKLRSAQCFARPSLLALLISSNLTHTASQEVLSLPWKLYADVAWNSHGALTRVWAGILKGGIEHGSSEHFPSTAVVSQGRHRARRRSPPPRPPQPRQQQTRRCQRPPPQPLLLRCTPRNRARSTVPKQTAKPRATRGSSAEKKCKTN